MAKGKATVTFPDGSTYTRRTDREYTFAVGYQYDQQLEAQTNLDDLKATLANYQGKLDGTIPFGEYCSINREWYINRIEAMAIKEIPAAEAALYAAEGKHETWAAEVFSSRRDLIEKAMAKGQVYARRKWNNLTICPVVFQEGN